MIDGLKREMAEETGGEGHRTALNRGIMDYEQFFVIQSLLNKGVMGERRTGCNSGTSTEVLSTSGIGERSNFQRRSRGGPN